MLKRGNNLRLTTLTPVARLSDMQCEVWVTASCRLNYLAILLISCTLLVSQRKVLSEIGKVCGEIKKTFIFVWNRSGWGASKSFNDRCQNGRPTCPPWASAEIFSGGGKRQHFAHLSQIADDAMPIDIHKTLFPFSGPQPADIFGVGVKW